MDKWTAESEMVGDTELFKLLPSQRTDILATAIGRNLEDIERLFLLDLPTFVQDARFDPAQFFSLNSGPVQFRFDDGLTHAYDVWPSQLSVINLPAILTAADDERLYRLGEDEAAPPKLKSCLGQRCQDVRIWTLAEEFESQEAKEVAVSYFFSADWELFYCIYLHGDLDSDYLLMGADVPRHRVKSCFSLAQSETIEFG
jgi:hypothetical protein